jgi:hypothetical protein
MDHGENCIMMNFTAYDELHSLYSSPNIVRVIKSKRLRWVGHVARMGEGRGGERCLQGFGWEARG